MNAKFNILNLNKFDFISESLLENSRFRQKCLLLFFEYNEFKLYEELDQLCDIIENWYVEKSLYDIDVGKKLYSNNSYDLNDVSKFNNVVNSNSPKFKYFLIHCLFNSKYYILVILQSINKQFDLSEKILASFKLTSNIVDIREILNARINLDKFIADCNNFNLNKKDSKIETFNVLLEVLNKAKSPIDAVDKLINVNNVKVSELIQNRVESKNYTKIVDKLFLKLNKSNKVDKLENIKTRILNDNLTKFLQRYYELFASGKNTEKYLKHYYEYIVKTFEKQLMLMPVFEIKSFFDKFSFSVDKILSKKDTYILQNFKNLILDKNTKYLLIKNVESIEEDFETLLRIHVNSFILRTELSKVYTYEIRKKQEKDSFLSKLQNNKIFWSPFKIKLMKLYDIVEQNFIHPLIENSRFIPLIVGPTANGKSTFTTENLIAYIYNQTNKIEDLCIVTETINLSNVYNNQRILAFTDANAKLISNPEDVIFLKQLCDGKQTTPKRYFKIKTTITNMITIIDSNSSITEFTNKLYENLLYSNKNIGYIQPLTELEGLFRRFIICDLHQNKFKLIKLKDKNEILKNLEKAKHNSAKEFDPVNPKKLLSLDSLEPIYTITYEDIIDDLDPTQIFSYEETIKAFNNKDFKINWKKV